MKYHNYKRSKNKKPKRCQCLTDEAMPRDEETVDRIFAGNLDGLPPLSSKVITLKIIFKTSVSKMGGCRFLAQRRYFQQQYHYQGKFIVRVKCRDQTVVNNLFKLSNLIDKFFIRIKHSKTNRIGYTKFRTKMKNVKLRKTIYNYNEAKVGLTARFLS